MFWKLPVEGFELIKFGIPTTWFVGQNKVWFNYIIFMPGT